MNKMKYLKLFEKFNLSEIENHCRNYLAYLLDTDFYLEVVDSSDPIIILKSHSIFTWSDIKDIFISFIDITSKEYNIKEVKINGNRVKINTIINDEIITNKINIIEIVFGKNQDRYRNKRGLL